MEIGNRIKKCRENVNLSQEELAEKVYVSRQTISNWENDKSYPDINSLKRLSNIFDISIDDLVKEDMEKMKMKIKESDISNLNLLSIIYGVELLIIIISAYPLLKFLGMIGTGIWVVFAIITCITAVEIEKIKKENKIFTYKEIVAFCEKKTLSHEDKISENAKRPYQKVLLTILSGFIGIIIFVLMEILLG